MRLPRSLVTELVRVECDGRNARRLAGRAKALVQLDKRRSAEESGGPGSPRSPSSQPYGRERAHAARSRGSRPSVTPENCGCTIDPWPSTKSRSPFAAPSTTSRSAAPARKSATTASTAIPQPAMAIPVWPVGTKTERSPRSRAARSSSIGDGLLPDRTVRPDREDNRRVMREVRTVRDAEIGRRACGDRGSRRRARGRARRALGRRRGTRACPTRGRDPPEHLCDGALHSGGSRPPASATPTRAVVGRGSWRAPRRQRRRWAHPPARRRRSSSRPPR